MELGDTCTFCNHKWIDHTGPIMNWERSCDYKGCPCLLDVLQYPQVTWDQITPATLKLSKEQMERASINHPAHYGGDGTYETIKVVEAWKLDFNLGNAIKYISRAEHKGKNVEDLEKAKWYIERAIRNANERRDYGYTDWSTSK
jgi:hypothetical protein